MPEGAKTGFIREIFARRKYRRLERALRSSSYLNVYKRALEELSRGGERAVPILLDELITKKRDSVSFEIARALGGLRSQTPVPKLIQLLTDPDLGGPAAVALGKIGDVAAVDALCANVCRLSYRGAEALGLIRDKRALPYLISALDDREESVRAGAAWALGELRCAEAIQPLLRRRSDPESRVREAITSALAALGWPAALAENRPLQNIEKAAAADGTRSPEDGGLTYQVVTDGSITRIAEESNQFRRGEGVAALVKFDIPLDAVREGGAEPELVGAIHCTCGALYPIRFGFRYDGGKPWWCPSCGKQVGIHTAGGSRAPVGDRGLLICVSSHDHRPVRISIDSVSRG
jgi:hypothetical protein